MTGRKRGKGWGRIGLAAWVLAVCSWAAAAWAAPAAPGGRAALRFTCRHGDGAVAVTNDPEAARKGPRSPYFVEPSEFAPVWVDPGGKGEPLGPSFEGEVLGRLAPLVLFQGTGETREVKLRAGAPPTALRGDTPTARLPRVVRWPMEERFPRSQFPGAEPGGEVKVGQPFAADPLMPGQVAEVTASEVVVRYRPSVGAAAEDAFGPVTVRDAGDAFEVVQEAPVGRLVRANALAGRISARDEETFTLDFGDAFGGEELTCTVTVEAVEPGDGKEKAPARSAAQGDLVLAHFTLTTEKGELVATTLPAEAGRPRAVYSLGLLAGGPEAVVTGKAASVPGLEEAVAGLKAGVRRHVTLGPEAGYGKRDEAKVVVAPAVKRVPRHLRLTAGEFADRFQVVPAQGQELDVPPYLRARLTKVDASGVTLEMAAEEGKTFEEPFGTAEVRTEGEDIVVRLRARVGADFPAPEGEGKGRIVAAEGETFTVDLNHPLAGQSLSLDVEAVSVTPAAELSGRDLPWEDEVDRGLAEARALGKPTVLFLYADWCSWCKKLKDEVFSDLRLEDLRERFSWVRVNSDVNKAVGEKYAQKSFPLLLVLGPDGHTLRRIEGYRGPGDLRRELMQAVSAN